MNYKLRCGNALHTSLTTQKPPSTQSRVLNDIKPDPNLTLRKVILFVHPHIVVSKIS